MSNSSRDSSPSTASRLSYFRIENESAVLPQTKQKISSKMIISVVLGVLFVTSALLGLLTYKRNLPKKLPLIVRTRLFDSIILNDIEDESLASLGNFTKTDLLYRGSRDGFFGYIFHAKCDKIPHTLTLIKSHLNSVFGGYISKPWKSSKSMIEDTEAFLFSIRKLNTSNLIGEKFSINPNETWCAAFDYENHGPTFGCNNDIFINEKPDTVMKSHSNFCSSYSCGLLNITKSSESRKYLAGAENFYVSEIEVFHVKF